jgi:double-strand break repair protein AddB
MAERPAVYALPPGADFPRAFAAGLVARHKGAAPEALARVQVYLNTGRMRRAVRAALAVTGPLLLPRLGVVADLGAAVPGLAPPAPRLRRLLEVARLVQRLLDRMPGLAPPGATFALAESLASLADEMQGEGIAPAALAALDVGAHAEHWQRAQAFLAILADYLADPGTGGAAARQAQAVTLLEAAWAAAPPAHPVIVAGSTGSRGATARLMAAVARLPGGAVVLPGFDFAMPGAAWAALEDAATAEDHPQYRHFRLLKTLGMTPDEVRPWVEAAAPGTQRNRLISLALRPAPVTDVWRVEGPGLGDLGAATAGITLIEAPSPRAEALALACRLRAAVEAGVTAALITPDRTLTRQVTAALDRWGLRPDDSAGQPLALSPPGRFLRQVAGLFGRPLTAEALIALLKHPLAHSGAGRGEHLLRLRDLELDLRRRGPAFPTGDDLIAWAGRGKGRGPWAEWLAAALAGIEDAAPAPLAEAVARHLRLSEALAGGPAGGSGALWLEAPGAVARLAMTALAQEAAAGDPLDPAAFSALLETHFAAYEVRDPVQGDPRVTILGTIEARAQGADLVLLAGLNEGSWPAAPPPDPWLSRPMRMAAGLLLPERQIGLAAHDFQQAAAAPEIVLSRAVRDAEAETVPSRWLNRLTTLLAGLAPAGPEALRDMRARGADWLALARAVETPEAEVPRAARPAPRPPVAARPRELTVTEIQRLIRDPYAIYARRILGLRPLDPLRPGPDASLRGEALHEVMARFLREAPDAEGVEAGVARLLATADAVLAAEVPWPSARRLWRAGLARIAPVLVAREGGRPRIASLIEQDGQVTLPALNFTLKARADRIDELPDGRLHVIDYKSGRVPSQDAQKHFDKQLRLEAAMAEAGGFAAFGPRKVARVTYVGLGSGAPEITADLAPGEAAQVWAELAQLIAAYDRPSQGYASRRAVEKVRWPGDYDHLARFGEWDTTAPPEPEDVG